MEKHYMKLLPTMLFFTWLTWVLPLTAFAWNSFGHMVVANIAYQHLNPAVREKVDNLVTYFHQEYPNMHSFMQIAYWPDRLHSQKIETFTHWHYINYAFSNDGTPLKNLIDTDNAIWAFNTITVVVKNIKANPYERARFLAFLIHIVGDLHQPLHTTSRVSAVHSNGDNGGNLYYVLYNNTRIKLHKLWDSSLGVFEGDDSPERVNTVTNIITSLYPENYFGNKINDFNPENWAKEGMNNAELYVYNTPENQIVSPTYIEMGKQVAEQEIALAGYRLAQLLNQML